MSEDNPLSCWVVSDGRRGIENQALGLAEAISRKYKIAITRHQISNKGAFKAAPARLQFALKSNPYDYGLPIDETPHLVIGCGRQAIAPLLALKNKHPACFTVYLQDPHIDPAKFDIVVAPEHDSLSGDNVETTLGSLNRVTEEQIVIGLLKQRDKIKTLPMPRISMMIGGTSGTYKLSEENHRQHLEIATQALQQGYSLLISASRRTPEWVIDDYHRFESDHDSVWFYDGTDENNPYFAFLGGADAICVTEDSTNMLTEACATGKPVFRLPMKGRPGKFSNLYQALDMRCNVTAFSGTFEALAYDPLNETNRIADHILAHIEVRGATLN